MPTWKLELEYNGKSFRGWQAQKNASTVQGVLEAAALDLFKARVETGGAGRTDAGVHALHQVAHLRCVKYLPAPKIWNGLNDRLPASIHILSVEDAPDRFHARRDATCRYYLYQIALRRTAFVKDWVWWIKEPLNLPHMIQAVQLLPGRHDFAIYQDKRVDEEQSTLVRVVSAQLVRSGNLLLFRIGASHFLWRMVRRLVGVLVRIGRGEMSLQEFQESLNGKGPDVAPWTAPASGLFLERVLYTGDPPVGDLRPLFRL